jgi:Mitochondrial carrier protein
MLCSLQVQKGAAVRGQAATGALSLVRTTLQQQGVGGLYRGYWATLSRNVPSAVLRFSLYEELKLHMKPHHLGRTPVRFLVAGAVAGALASGITTPFDVIKTQVSVRAAYML